MANHVRLTSPIWMTNITFAYHNINPPHSSLCSYYTITTTSTTTPEPSHHNHHHPNTWCYIVSPTLMILAQLYRGRDRSLFWCNSHWTSRLVRMEMNQFHVILRQDVSEVYCYIYISTSIYASYISDWYS